MTAFEDAEKSGGAWHYCAGLVYLSRAALEATKEKKMATYKRALDEISFSARKVMEDHRVYGEIHLNSGKGSFFSGEIAASKTMLEQLIRKMPTYVPAKMSYLGNGRKRNSCKAPLICCYRSTRHCGINRLT